MRDPLRLRVVSYNVLSSHLARADQFPTVNPDHLVAANRLPVILQKLRRQMEEHSNVVLCLQEVSYDWAAALHVFFAQHDYYFVNSHYGKSFNGYMGVCLAWPRATLQLEDLHIERLSDTRQAGWPRTPKPTMLQSLSKALYGLLWEKTTGRVWRLLVPAKKDGPPDHWDFSAWRLNILVTAVLRDAKDPDQKFTVGTYHMPCAYYCPMAMTLHADLCAHRVQTHAQTAGGIPYVLAGDFNIKPEEPVYQFLTTGQLNDADSYRPTPKYGMEWEPTSHTMVSAYANHLGQEPPFTNYAQSREGQPPFVATLDYIFLSPQTWKVEEVEKLATEDSSKPPYPNLDCDEPSDHVLIAATLKMEATRTQAATSQPSQAASTTDPLLDKKVV